MEEKLFQLIMKKKRTRKMVCAKQVQIESGKRKILGKKKKVFFNNQICV